MSARILICLAGIVVGGFAAGCGGGGSPSASTPSTPPAATATSSTVPKPVRPATPDLVVIVVETTVSGGGRKTIKLGEPVRIQFIADVADEVHLHGYDKKVRVAPGRPATLVFTPDIPGVFEVELEEKGLKLLDLVVK